MSDLYPSFDMPDIVGATENTVVAFPKSWLWDWDICDFVQRWWKFSFSTKKWRYGWQN